MLPLWTALTTKIAAQRPKTTQDWVRAPTIPPTTRAPLMAAEFSLCLALIGTLLT